MATLTPRRAVVAAERGVVLLFALIALVVLLIGATALIRSFNTSLFMAGNIGFKRDLQHQGERAAVIAQRAFSGIGTGTASCPTGSLSTETVRQNDLPACNYYASIQASSVDSQGVPTILTNGGATLNALTNATDSTIDPSITVIYMIDRLCTSAGNAKTLGPAGCALAFQSPSGSGVYEGTNAGTTGTGQQAAVPQNVVYRLSVLVTGPRRTRSFFQSTFSVAS